MSHIPHLRRHLGTSTHLVAGESARDVGKRLDVELILEGSVQRVEDRIRVTANLIDAAREQSVRPALRVERRFDDILTVQDEISREIADGLTPSLRAPPAGVRRTRRRITRSSVASITGKPVSPEDGVRRSSIIRKR